MQEESKEVNRGLVGTNDSKESLFLGLQKQMEASDRVISLVSDYSSNPANPRSRPLITEGQLEKVKRTLELLADSQNRDQIKAYVHEINDIFNFAERERAQQDLDHSNRKDKEQDRTQQYHRSQVAKWQIHIHNLCNQIERAKRIKADISQEEQEVLRMRKLVEDAEKALNANQNSLLIDSLSKLQDMDISPETLSNQIESKFRAAQCYERQSSLLVNRIPHDAKNKQYLWALTVPSAPGSPGESVADNSTVTQQDYGRIKKEIEEITKLINLELTRELLARKVEERVMPIPSDISSGPADGPFRRLRPIDNDTEMLTQKNPNALLEEIGDLIYRLCMPEQMQVYLAERPSSLLITTNELELPWELMVSNWSENKFLCLDRPVARMPVIRPGPRRKRTVGYSKEKLRFLLVYADPDANLPEAGDEIREIEAQLHNRGDIAIDVLQREEAEGANLNEALRCGSYHVIHFAGHGEFNEADPDSSGLLLHGSEIFYAEKISRLLEGRPLVYLNACETGRTVNEREPRGVGRYLQRPAEGLASSFIYGGALGCIGALWPIYDRPAAEFAIEFYSRILEGHMIGEAMRIARCRIKSKYPNNITWASYVLYGDPTCRLIE